MHAALWRQQNPLLAMPVMHGLFIRHSLLMPD